MNTPTAQTLASTVPSSTSGDRVIYISPLRLESRSRLLFFRRRDAVVSVDGGNDLRTYARRAPSFHDDPDGARLFSGLSATTVSYAPPFIVSARNVRQIGYRSYVTARGNLFNDEALISEAEENRFLARLSQREPFPNEDTGLIATDRPRAFTLDPRQRPLQRLAGEVVSLCSSEPTNYGSFLFRVLPKLAGRPQLTRNRRVIAPMYTQTMRDLLELAGAAASKLIPHNTQIVYKMEHAIIPSLRNAHGLLDVDTISFYKDLRTRYGTRRGARRIFVSRLGWTASYAANHRIMLNEANLSERLSAEGFETVQTHLMTAREQIETFSSAEIIVGGAGSAMFNVVFAHPGTKVIDIESEPHWIFSHMNLFGSCGLDYGIFEAKASDSDWSSPHKPFTVNIDALLARLGSL